jgi:hypothetical protein
MTLNVFVDKQKLEEISFEVGALKEDVDNPSWKLQ